jgi:hypothetical protein
METKSIYVKLSDKPDLKALKAECDLQKAEVKTKLDAEKSAKEPSKEIIEVKELLMSGKEFANGGKDIKGIPVTITPDGEPPVFPTDEDLEREMQDEVQTDLKDKTSITK